MKVQTVKGVSFEGGGDISILDSALASGHVFEYSCKNGQCGVCKAELIEGEVVEIQPQIALSEIDKEHSNILTCCCAPKTNIIIDAEELSVLKGIEVKTLPARVHVIEQVSEHIVAVQLRLPPSANLKFLEGQFIDVLACGVRRSYSIASTVNEQLLTLYIKKLEGGVLSQYWFYDVKQNDLIRIEGPKGSFFFREPMKRVIFLATGTGIAPVKAILDKLESQAEIYENISFSLLWGNRYIDDFFWEPSYVKLKLNFIPVLSRPQSRWGGRTGYVQDVFIEEDTSLEFTQIYACGSLQMIQSASEKLIEKGLDKKCFYADAFVSS